MKILDPNKFQKVVHVSAWFGEKIALSQVVKEAYHKGYWSDAGGKVEPGETWIEAAKREFQEEMGLRLMNPVFVDFFIYTERQIKTCLFKVNYSSRSFRLVLNKEPDKQSEWRLFTPKEALKLKLMPSVKNYLESIK